MPANRKGEICWKYDPHKFWRPTSLCTSSSPRERRSEWCTQNLCRYPGRGRGEKRSNTKTGKIYQVMEEFTSATR